MPVPLVAGAMPLVASAPSFVAQGTAPQHLATLAPVATAPQVSQNQLCRPPHLATAVVPDGPGPVRIGSRAFERIGKLGHGSFGVVWEAQEQRCGGGGGDRVASVALKCSGTALWWRW